jgi:hypothetical protein
VDGEHGGGVKIEMVSGKGLLDARALWASIVGPQRLAMAQKTVAKLTNTNAVEISKNLGASNAYVFIGVGLPFPAPMATLNVVFGRDEQLGFNSGYPQLLTKSPVNFAFTQLLQPGEQLFCQITDAVAQQNVVVAAVMF